MALTATTAPARPNRAIARFAGLVFAGSIATAAVVALAVDDSQPATADPRPSAPAVVEARPTAPAAAEHALDPEPAPAAAEHALDPERVIVRPAEHTLNP